MLTVFKFNLLVKNLLSLRVTGIGINDIVPLYAATCMRPALFVYIYILIKSESFRLLKLYITARQYAASGEQQWRVCM